MVDETCELVLQAHTCQYKKLNCTNEKMNQISYKYLFYLFLFGVFMPEFLLEYPVTNSPHELLP